jgi:hypothetical protein
MSAKARNIVMRLLLALCALSLLGLIAYGQDVTVKVVRYAGKVEVRASGETAWAKVKNGQLLKAGDTLRTLKGGKVQLLFPKNTLVLIKENSVLNVKELNANGGGKVKTVVGGFLFNLQEALAPGSTFEVETPTALAVVRGTKLGADVAFDGTSEFTGYEGTFDVVAQGVTRTVGAGEKVGVNPGEAPGEVGSSDESWEGAGGDEEAGEATYTADQYSSRFNTLANRFRLLAARMDMFYQEYVRYEAEGDLARNELVYYSVQPIMEQCDQFDGDLADLTALLQGDPELGWIITGGEPTEGSQEAGEAITGYISACRTSSSQIRAQYASMDAYISANLDPQQVLDELQGIIQSTDPAQDIRYGNIDTDNDGIPDVVELQLSGGEPNMEEPLITLIEPEDNAQFAYPDDSSIHFEFEASSENAFQGFELHLEAGGHELVRQFVDTSMDLTIADLTVSPDSPFVDLFQEGQEVDFTWFVRGRVDFNQWGAELDGAHHTSSVLDIDSDTRTFSLNYPAGQIAGFDLAVIGPVPVPLGEPIRLRVEVSDVNGLARWEVVINYDPSKVEFNSGLRSGITNGTTLFFGDDGRGHVTISGEVGPTAAPLSGNGSFAEISFSTLETGIALFEFSDISLFTAGGQAIGATEGGSAEVEISGQPAV